MGAGSAWGGSKSFKDRPADASDVTDLASAREEIRELRAFAAKVQQAKERDRGGIENFPYLRRGHFAHGDSFAAKVLTPELYEELFEKGPTSFGVTIDDVIRVAVDFPVLDGGHLTMGLFAGDEECYDHFEKLFKPVIKEYHGFDMGTDVHVSNTNPAKLHLPPDPDPASQFILSTRIRAGRQIAGFRFPAACSRGERRKVESLLKGAFAGFEGELTGTYTPVAVMSATEKKRLVGEHARVVDCPDMWSTLGGIGRDWPDARGIFINGTRDCVIWVNEEDHVRCTVTMAGSDATAVFSRWATAVNGIDTYLKSQGTSFAIHPKLGALTGCPSNLGTGMRASVHIKLHRLALVPGFKEYCKAKLKLQVRGRGGEMDMKNTGVFDVSNLDRLGTSEVEIVADLMRAVGVLITHEKALEQLAQEGKDTLAYELA